MAEHEEGRCFKERAEDGPSLLHGGNLIWQTYHIGWIIASMFTIIATVVSFWLIYKHLKWYTNKREQRHIVRILFMVPIYAIVSLASYFWWNHATPLILIRDGYESTVLTSFFYLLLIYLSPHSDEQRALFQKIGLSKEADNEALWKGQEPQKWIFPMGFVKWKPSTGLSFLQIMKWGVLQYCVLRPTTTFAAVILDYIGLYCESSWGPGWGHIYIVVIVSISVTIAMYCLIQLYVSASTYLAPQKPLLKLFAIKAVVFLTFWQATFLSALSMFGVVKDTRYMTAEDINIGIGALLETFEMMLFAFLHVHAFTYKVYKPIHNSRDLPTLPMGKWRALGHAMDYRETFREIWVGSKYMWAKLRGQEPSVDVGARRQAYYEDAFGRTRPSHFPIQRPTRKDNDHVEPKDADVTFPSVQVDADSERVLEVGGGRDWLGAGNHYGYGIYREKSEGLEEQIEKELAKRGYGYGGKQDGIGHGHIRPPAEEAGHQYHRSWWRSIYNRLSQHTDHDQDTRLSPPPSRAASRSKSRRKSSHRTSQHMPRERETENDLLSDYLHGIDDPPPASVLKKFHGNPLQSHRTADDYMHPADDVLAPLSVYNDHQTSQLQRQQMRQSPRSAAVPLSPSPPLLSSSPPQMPLLAPQLDASKDSLLGRVFPSRTDLSTAHTDSSNTRSFFSPSTSHGHEIGLAGERQVYHSQVPAPLMPEVVDVFPTHPRTVDQPRAMSGQRPEGTRSVPIPVSLPLAPQFPGKNSPHGLKRSSAQVYSPREQSSRMNRQSSSIQPQAQQPPYNPLATRRRSTPMVLTVPAPLAPQARAPVRHDLGPIPRLRSDNMDSTLSQPSYSGTLDADKYTNPSPPMSSTPESEIRANYYSRYPGMPPDSPPTSPTRPIRNMPSSQYTNHHFPINTPHASNSPHGPYPTPPGPTSGDVPS